MRAFLSIAAFVICLGASAPDARAGSVGGFMAFNAVQSSFSFNGSETLVGATLSATIVAPTGMQLFFGATEPTNFMSMTVAGPVGILTNMSCPMTPINGVDQFLCDIQTTTMAFDGNTVGNLVTITGHLCDTQVICGPTATSTFRVTPEPGILALIAAGLLGMGLARRRATAA
jgi:hypothetical protein